MLVTLSEVKEFLDFEENYIYIGENTDTFIVKVDTIARTGSLANGKYTFAEAATVLQNALDTYGVSVAYSSVTNKFTLSHATLDLGIITGGSTASFLYGFTIDVDPTSTSITSDTAMTVYSDVLSDIHLYIEDFIKKYIHNPIESASYTEYYSGDNYDMLFLEHYPVTSIASITVDSASLSASDYEIDYDTGSLYYYAGWDKGFNNIEVNYVAGHSTIPETIKFAVLNMIKFYYERYKSNLIGITEYSISSLKQKFENFMLWEVQKTSELYTKVRVG